MAHICQKCRFEPVTFFRTFLSLDQLLTDIAHVIGPGLVVGEGEPEELVETSNSKSKTPVAQESGQNLFAAPQDLGASPRHRL